MQEGVNTAHQKNKMRNKKKKKKELEELKLMFHQKEAEMQILTNKDTKNIVLAQAAPAYVSNSSCRKYFKISGQIVHPGQKDRIRFSSLARRIENGLSMVTLNQS